MSAIAIVIGFLLGDRRGLKQANEVLEHNNRVLLQAIGDEQPVCPDDDAEPAPPTVP